MIVERAYSTILSLPNSEKFVFFGPSHLSEPTGIIFFKAHLSSFLHLWALDIYTLGLTDFFSRDRYDPLYPGTLAWLIILTGFFPPWFY